MSDNGVSELSIGLPVFNGDNFLEEALDSILKQDFNDFELIISDNASTDRTESICRAYAEKDGRIRYFRNQQNIGAAGNWNRVFELSSGKYFKWIAHDDLHELDFVSRCIEVLKREPVVVLAFTRAITVDAGGKFIREWGAHTEICASDVCTRYRRALAAAEDPLPLPIFGVMRADVLRKTRQFMGYPEADVALLAELSLYGPFSELAAPLFVQREHDRRAGPELARDPYRAASFWNPRKDQQLRFPHWSLLAGHFAGLLAAPLQWRERMNCGLAVSGWAKRHLGQLASDLVVAGTRLPGLGPMFGGMARKIYATVWTLRVGRAARDLKSLIPTSVTCILLDDGAFGDGMAANLNVRAFPEEGGEYAGPPPDDETAVSELERMREDGAAFLAFGWPCFWWLTYYRGFADHLNKNFCRVLENSRLVVFDLRSPRRND
jgi:glycosyltransferase involved in cell wall biosynthesis